jgi:hypothetical protein
MHRRLYLKARKNDKPAISRAIVRSIRNNDGRFLKKDEKSSKVLFLQGSALAHTFVLCFDCGQVSGTKSETTLQGKRPRKPFASVLQR